MALEAVVVAVLFIIIIVISNVVIVVCVSSEQQIANHASAPVERRLRSLELLLALHPVTNREKSSAGSGFVEYHRLHARNSR